MILCVQIHKCVQLIIMCIKKCIYLLYIIHSHICEVRPFTICH